MMKLTSWRSKVSRQTWGIDGSVLLQIITDLVSSLPFIISWENSTSPQAKDLMLGFFEHANAALWFGVPAQLVSSSISWLWIVTVGALALLKFMCQKSDSNSLLPKHF